MEMPRKQKEKAIAARRTPQGTAGAKRLSGKPAKPVQMKEPVADGVAGPAEDAVIGVVGAAMETSSSAVGAAVASGHRDEPNIIVEKMAAAVPLPLELLDPHPHNPRLVFDERVIGGIVAQMRERGSFDPAHAITVRPRGARFEIVHGHQRCESARRAGLAEVFAFVRDMSDEQALLELALGNTQGELTLLEIALHSLAVEPAQGQRGQGLVAYAAKVAMAPPNLSRYRRGALVFVAVRGELGTSDDFIRGARAKAEQFALVHRAERIHWAALTRWIVETDATIEATRERVSEHLPEEDEVHSAEGSQETEAPAPQASDAELLIVSGEEGQTSDRPEPQPTATSVTATGASSSASNDGQLAPVHAPVAAKDNAPPAANGGAARGDDRRARGVVLLRARGATQRELSGMFAPVHNDILLRALRSLDAHPRQDDAFFEDAVAHLAEQQQLAQRLRDLVRQCDELAEQVPRAHRKYFEAVKAAATKLHESRRDLGAKRVAEVEARFVRARTRLATAQAPIEYAVRRAHGEAL